MEEDQSLVKQKENQDSFVSPMENIEYHRVADFLEVGWEERRDLDLADRIDYIYKYAQQRSGSEDRTKALLALKDITRGLGITHKGKELVKKLYRWTRLDSQRQKIEREMELV